MVLKIASSCKIPFRKWCIPSKSGLSGWIVTYYKYRELRRDKGHELQAYFHWVIHRSFIQSEPASVRKIRGAVNVVNTVIQTVHFLPFSCFKRAGKIDNRRHA